MASHIDREVLLGFVDEARSYLPKIHQGIDSAKNQPGQPEVLEEAHRLVHSIKGAASMIGLAPLGHIAFFVEEAIEQVAAGQLMLDAKTAGALGTALDVISAYLDHVVSGNLRVEPMVTQVVRSFRRLRGADEAGDAAEIQRLVGTGGLPEVPPPASPSAVESEAFVADDVDSEVSPELMEAFMLEAEDHLQAVSAKLRELERTPDDRDVIQDVRRRVHTLKGAAAMVGLGEVSRLAHRMEDLLDALYAGEQAADAETIELLFSAADALTDLATGDVDLLSSRQTLSDLYRRLGALVSAPPEVSEEPRTELQPLDEEKVIDVAGMAGAPAEALGQQQATRAPSQMVRIPLERLDELVRLASELVVNRSSFEQHFGKFRREVGELRLSNGRLRRIATRAETDYEVLAFSAAGQPTVGSGPPTALAAAGGGGSVLAMPSPVTDFDELELDRYNAFHLLSREMSETASDIGAVGNELTNSIGDFDGFLSRLSLLTSDIQDRLMRLRMVPFATIATRLHRTARVTASKQSKKVDLVIEGERTELDKTVLEEMADPLLHLLRNAVDHGIEPPALRQALGKPERGRIFIQALHQGTDVVIRMRDDGAGLDPAALRSAAVRGGLLTEADASEADDSELYSLIFLPGFSTARDVTEISGRGVGLDVVKANVDRIKGSLTVSSVAGEGATFVVRLPLTLAITRVLMVRAGMVDVAVPLGAVTQILRLEPSAIERLGHEPVVRVEDQVHPAVFLHEALGISDTPGEISRRVPVLILDLGGATIALVVDQILEAREVVVKNLGNLLRRVPGIAGATLMGDGRVVLILNPTDLLTADASPAPMRPTVKLPAERAQQPIEVMIVDDSVSVRRVLSNLVKNAGWSPVVARDGLDALEILQRLPRRPDVMLLDIEMPRMDGYELTSTLRGEEAFAELPIVMLTSRSGEKHRQRAFELGATDYLVKPYQSETLLNVVRRLAREARSSSES